MKVGGVNQVAYTVKACGACQRKSRSCADSAFFVELTGLSFTGRNLQSACHQHDNQDEKDDPSESAPD